MEREEPHTATLPKKGGKKLGVDSDETLPQHMGAPGYISD